MSTRFSGKICGTSMGFGMATEHEEYLLHFGESIILDKTSTKLLQP